MLPRLHNAQGTLWSDCYCSFLLLTLSSSLLPFRDAASACEGRWFAMLLSLAVSRAWASYDEYYINQHDQPPVPTLGQAVHVMPSSLVISKMRGAPVREAGRILLWQIFVSTCCSRRKHRPSSASSKTQHHDPAMWKGTRENYKRRH